MEWKRTFRARLGGLAFNQRPPSCSLALGSNPTRRVKAELQHIGVTAEGGTTQDGRCELTVCSSRLNSLSLSLDFHQDSQGVFGKQCNE